MKVRDCAVKIACLVVTALFVAIAVASAAKHPVQASDCVGVKYPFFYDNNNAYYGTIKISPDGQKIAYLVKAPNLEKNDNEFELYVRNIADTGRENGSLVSTGVNTSHIEWTNTSNSIVMLTGGDPVSLVSIDITTHKKTNIARTDKNIVEYAINSDGSVVVYTTEAVRSDSKEGIPHDRNELARGYRIVSRQSETASLAKIRLYTSRRKSDGQWTTPTPLRFRDPFGSADLSDFSTYGASTPQFLSLAPDASHLLFSYVTDHAPAEWEQHAYVKTFREAGTALVITVLYDMRSGTAVVPLNTVTALASFPVWSSDGQVYVVHAPSPFGSVWEQEDLAAHRMAPSETNTFEVHVRTGMVEEVFKGAEHDEPPLFVEPGGDVFIHTSERVVSRYSHGDVGWRGVTAFQLPLGAQDHIFSLISDGKQLIGVFETTTIPPEIFAYQLRSNAIRTLTKLNPQLESVDFASAKTIEWRTDDGVDITGIVFQPFDYVPGRRYPLVIQTKGLGSSFACDSGGNSHDPGFAPQPIASAGMFYLARGGIPRDAVEPQVEAEHFPKQYPGDLGEAAHAMDMWESAIRYLDAQGLIDPAKVGIIGFSRTGWYVEFALIRSKFRFAAASIEDNVTYGFGEYFLLARDTGTTDGDHMYGGPPYGETLKNWLDYSVSFNLDKIHTPLLMESMGYRVHDDTPGKIPLTIAVPSEIFVGLERLAKPVDWYYYPDDVHQPESPITRLSSMQRNVDWYRFWLQGYERPNPEDPEQYIRWRRLRELRDADNRKDAH